MRDRRGGNPSRLRPHPGENAVSEQGPEKNWFLTLPGLLSAGAAFLTALAGFVAAISGAFSVWGSHGAQPAKSEDCLPGYVLRLAVPDDRVCVTLESHRQAESDNQLGGSRRNPTGGAYGADTCQVGYVWREAFPEDHVCVTPETRKKTQEDNALAATRIKR